MVILSGCTNFGNQVKLGIYNNPITPLKINIQNSELLYVESESGDLLAGKYIIDGNKLLLQLDNEGGVDKAVVLEIKGDILKFVSGSLNDTRIREGTEFMYSKLESEGESMIFGIVGWGSLIIRGAVVVLGIYIMILVINALRLYIKNNSSH